MVLFLGGPEYLNSAKIIPYLLLFTMLCSFANIFQRLMLIKGSTLSLGIIYIFGVVINFIVSFLTIPRYGIWGSTFALIVTYSFILFCMVVCIKDMFTSTNSNIKNEY